MVSSPRLEAGAQVIPARLRKTIQSIKDVVGNHSDADIYVILKESNMDPDETAQKLLNQDPFHEVKRKRERKKESVVNRASIEAKEVTLQSQRGPRNQASWDRIKAGKAGFTRSFSRGTGVSREFRVVRDNRVNQNSSRYVTPASLEGPTSASQEMVSSVSLKSSPVFTDQKHPDGRKSELRIPPTCDSGPGHSRNVELDGTQTRVSTDEKTSTALKSEHQVHPQRSHNSPSNTAASSNTSVGLYSSSTDPIHVPNSDSRSYRAVGAIRREVGVVGVRRQSSQDSVMCFSVRDTSSTLMGKDISSAAESSRQSLSISKGSQFGHAPIVHPLSSGIPGRPFSGNQYSSKSHQPPVGLQKVSQSNMEWKPKSSKKSNAACPGMIVNAPAPASSPLDIASASVEGVAHLPEKLSQVTVSEDQVIIPLHLRVAKADRVTFGSFEQEFDSTKSFVSCLQSSQRTEDPKDELAVSASVPVSSIEDVSGSEAELPEGQGSSGNASPASDAASVHPLTDTKGLASPKNLENYRRIGLFQRDNSSFSPDALQQHDPSSLATFSTYDSQTYNEPFFRSERDENVQVHGLASPQEALLAHPAISAPPLNAAMLQQPGAHVYQQLHVSNYPNIMPYRQFLAPVYVPPMAVPNYSNNTSYPHPSSGSSYLLMQGGSAHLPPGGALKYAVSQYKPVPIGGTSGYGNYNNAAGYTMSMPGAVGSAPVLEDTTRVKYKEGGLYFPNPQVDTSELWVQPPRELPSLQSTSYYNLSGQAPHASFMPSLMAHASFNPPVQSSHVPFPGLYHPPQPTAIANPHHLVHQQLPGMGGNVGVGIAAPGPQMGAYQQTQAGHLNWTTSF